MAKGPNARTGTLYDQGDRVRVDGLDTWVVRAGPRGEAPVVFLHGIPTSAFAWRGVVEAMHEEFDCIAFDWPGFGSSAKPPEGDYTHRARAKHLAALLDALHVPKARLVVHDVGGPAGLLFAVEHPERVERLAVLNTTVFKRDYRPPLPAVSQFIPGVRELSRPLFQKPAFLHFFKQGLHRPERVPDAVLEAHWRLAESDGGRDPVLEAWAQFRDGAEAIATIRQRLGALEVPTLVLFGAEDRFLPPSIAERLAKEIPRAELQLLPGAGHFLMEDAPEEVADRLAAFFRA